MLFRCCQGVFISKSKRKPENVLGKEKMIVKIKKSMSKHE